jgi:hypothetical protein
MRKPLITTLACAALAIAGCSKDDGGNGNGGGNTIASTLSAPANNTECLTGTEVSTTQNKVTFQWNASEGSQSYLLYVKDLNAQSTLQFNAATATTYDVTLTKGTPYSWYVGAKKADGTTVKSETWKFYNAGTAIISHPPFPADAVAPIMSSTVNGPAITLKWTSSDVDNDITTNEVYMDNNTNPTTLLNSTAQQQLDNVSVTSARTYYWKVITKDAAGNATTSPVYQFKVY